MDDKLRPLPCPFCGYVAVAYDDGEDRIVTCSNDDCGGMPCSVGNKTVAAAIERWNRRTPDGDGFVRVPRAELEALRQLSEKATPGPWRHMCYMSGTQNVEFPGSKGVAFVDAILAKDGEQLTMQSDSRNLIDVLHVKADHGNDADPERTANADLITAAVNLIRNLLALAPTGRNEGEG